MIEKEFMIANLRKQRDLLTNLMNQLSENDELEKGSRLLYDEVTKRVEDNLKELKKLRKEYAEHQASYQLYLRMNFDQPKKMNHE